MCGTYTEHQRLASGINQIHDTPGIIYQSVSLTSPCCSSLGGSVRIRFMMLCLEAMPPMVLIHPLYVNHYHDYVSRTGKVWMLVSVLDSIPMPLVKTSEWSWVLI